MIENYRCIESRPIVNNGTRERKIERLDTELKQIVITPEETEYSKPTALLKTSRDECHLSFHFCAKGAAKVILYDSYSNSLPHSISNIAVSNLTWHEDDSRLPYPI